jgi:hypothetical protein
MYLVYSSQEYPFGPIQGHPCSNPADPSKIMPTQKVFIGILDFSSILTRKITENEQSKNFYTTYLL